MAVDPYHFSNSVHNCVLYFTSSSCNNCYIFTIMIFILIPFVIVYLSFYGDGNNNMHLSYWQSCKNWHKGENEFVNYITQLSKTFVCYPDK